MKAHSPLGGAPGSHIGVVLVLTAALQALAPHGAVQTAAWGETKGQKTRVGTPMELFQQRLAGYLAIKAEVGKGIEPLRPLPSAAEVARRQNRHAAAVQEARSGAGTARLVPDAAASQIRSTLQAFFASQGNSESEHPIDLLPSGHPPVVNGRYFSYVPLSTIPPQLLAGLPVLPDLLQYRFHGDYLLLLDAELSLVLDIVPDALPPYGSGSPEKIPPAEPRMPGELHTAPVGPVERFAVIGDSGTGGRAQRMVAEQLVAARERFGFDFVLMLGDNLYGDEDPDDYIEKFAAPYAPLLTAGVTFHAALGNHDEPAQIYYEPFNMNGRRYYSLRRGPVEFFILDSTYMPPAQVKWLRDALTASDAPWKVATMHHPIYSTGRRHGASEDLRQVLEPVFVDHGVDLVLAGHEHFYERLVPQHGIHYMTSGSAAKLREDNVKGGAQSAAHFDEGFSFLLMRADAQALIFEAVSAGGRVVDSGRLEQRSESRR